MFLTRNKIHVAMIQETLLTSKSNLRPTPGYSVFRKDRDNNKLGGGLLFLIHKSISWEPINIINIPNGDKNTEVLSIAITGGTQDLLLHNIYIPPVSSCETNYSPPVANLLTNNSNTIVGGDFNAHHENWYSKGTEDNRGRMIADLIDNSNFGIANEHLDTRVTTNNISSPDITLATSDILPYIDWSTAYSLQSDHLPIIIKLKADLNFIPSKDRVYVNFAKADWEGFLNYTEEKFANIPLQENPLKGEKIFRRVVNNAAKKFIPKGRIPNLVHNVPTEAANLIKERDLLRENQPDSPRIKDLNEEIQAKINEHRRSKWHDHLDKCQRGSSNLWKTIKGISQPTTENNNINIKFQNKSVSSNIKIANNLNRQFTPAPSSKPSKEFRSTLRKLKNTRSTEDYKITEKQTSDAIKSSKNSKAIGPDGISPVMMKHLGTNAIKFLTKVYNRTINTATIPILWKTGKIIPLLKPKKPADAGKSYRPISLLSPPAKVLEKIILPDLECAVPLKEHQHGFRKSRSTVTALQEVTDHISRGLNSKRPANRTVLVAIDLSRAFDTVCHEQLLNDILNLNITHSLKKFLSSYLRGRHQYTVFRGCKSKVRIVRQGVPQGGVLSPLLFNLYISGMPEPPPEIKIIFFADDCQALSSGPHIERICETLNPYLNMLSDWFKSKKLEISAEKSTATVFTTWSNEAGRKLPIFLDNKEVPTIRNPKILGLNFDNMLNFGHHSKLLKNQVQTKNTVLKCLAGSSWGKDKEILTDTYKALGRSHLNYASSVWTPYLSKTNWSNLNSAQNTALRTITGCVKMTEVTHLNQETKILPVREHSEMLTKQFLTSMHQPSHPNHHLLSEPTPPRDIRKSILDYKSQVSDLDGKTSVTKEEVKAIHGRIHTNCVNSAITAYPANKVLQTRPPEVHGEEKVLPRTTRTTLAQLRSGYSPYLKSYLHRINRSDTDQCPRCQREPHTTQHLFECSSMPTTLNVKDLWSRPKKAAEFLELPTGAPDIQDTG